MPKLKRAPRQPTLKRPVPQQAVDILAAYGVDVTNASATAATRLVAGLLQETSEETARLERGILTAIDHAWFYIAMARSGAKDLRRSDGESMANELGAALDRLAVARRDASLAVKWLDAKRAPGDGSTAPLRRCGRSLNLEVRRTLKSVMAMIRADPSLFTSQAPFPSDGKKLVRAVADYVAAVAVATEMEKGSWSSVKKKYRTAAQRLFRQ